MFKANVNEVDRTEVQRVLNPPNSPMQKRDGSLDLDQALRMVDLIRDLDVSLGGLQQLVRSGILADIFSADIDRVDHGAVRRALKVSCPIHVDYSKTLEQMIEEMVAVVESDLDRYAMMLVNSSSEPYSAIDSTNFPSIVPGPADVDVEVVGFDDEKGDEPSQIEKEVVLEEIDKLGFRPANLPELIAFGARYRKHYQFPINALGTEGLWNPGGREPWKLLGGCLWNMGRSSSNSKMMETLATICCTSSFASRFDRFLVVKKAA